MSNRLMTAFRNRLPARFIEVARYVRHRRIRAAARVARALRVNGRWVIRAGPFAGMEYVPQAVGSELAPKLLGTYERELADCLLSHIRRGHDVFIDIGAAEGYFAVGFARGDRQTRCIAFEAAASGRRLIRQMAELNGVSERMIVEGWCSTHSLNAALEKAQSPFVLCDCEGGELELLDPLVVPGLRRAAILVEVHGRAELVPAPGSDHPTAMAELLTTRFAASHTITRIPIEPRSLSDWPATLASDLSAADRLAAMYESRSRGPGWLWMLPKLRST